MDLYERLGLQPEASDREIKSAYRKLSAQYHPDKNKGSEEAVAKFREIAEAYEILADKEKRVIYDSSGIGAVKKMVSWPCPAQPSTCRCLLLMATPDGEQHRSTFAHPVSATFARRARGASRAAPRPLTCFLAEARGNSRARGAGTWTLSCP